MAEIQHIVIGLLIFSGIMLGFGGFYNDLLGNYGYETNNLTSLQVISDVTNQTEELKIRTETKNTGDITAENLFFSTTNNVVQGIFLLFNIPNFIGSIITDLFVFIPGFPTWVGVVVVAIVTVIILFPIIASILKIRL